MTTLGDLARRLYDKFAATQELLDSKKCICRLPVPLQDLCCPVHGVKSEQMSSITTRWDDLPLWQQEVWVTVALEAVKVGAEIQQEIARQDAEANHTAMREFMAEMFERKSNARLRLLNDLDLQTNHDQTQRSASRVLHDFKMGYSGMSCVHMTLDENGHGIDCGRSASDPIHDLSDEAPKLKEFVNRPRRFHHDCE